MRMLWTILLIASATYLALAAYLYLFQANYVFFPWRALDATPADAGLGYEDVHLETEDGVNLHGWFVPTAHARFTLLFLHGNAGNISHRLDSLRLFNRLGLSTFIFDYRGYGRSAGKPTEAGTYRDATAAWRHLVVERGISAQRIVVFGRSLGGGVATWLASVQTPRALIIESTLTSVPDMGAQVYPFLPVRLLARIHYDTLARIPDVSCPILVVHSRQDDIIPFEHGRRIFDAAREPKAFLAIRGDHNSGFLISGEDYVRGLDGFLKGLESAPRPADQSKEEG